MKAAIHLRSLTTGNSHSLAPDPAILHHFSEIPARDFSVVVQVCTDRLAVHFVRPEADPSELAVWNWKTGKLELVSDLGELIWLIGLFIMTELVRS